MKVLTENELIKQNVIVKIINNSLRFQCRVCFINYIGIASSHNVYVQPQTIIYVISEILNAEAEFLHQT